MTAESDPRFTVGMIAEWKGQSYELVGYRPHINRNSREVTILVWRSHCRACGAPFEFTTPQRKFRDPNRNCQSHRLSREVCPNGADAIGFYSG